MLATQHTIVAIVVSLIAAANAADAGALVARQSIPTPTEGAGYLPSPIAQPSLAQSLGSFNVVSLARSSSYNFDQAGQVSQTTTFQAGSPEFSSQQAVAASYATGDSGSNNSAAKQQAASTTALPSLTGTSTASVIASGNGNAAASLRVFPSGAVALPLLTVFVAVVAGAGWVM